MVSYDPRHRPGYDLAYPRGNRSWPPGATTFLHRRRWNRLLLALRLRRCARRSSPPAKSHSAVSALGFRLGTFGCIERQLKLFHLFVDRDRLPSPETLDVSG